MTPFGTDRATPRADGAVEIACLVGKGWRTRRERTATSPEHPGTAVRWEGLLFEVVAATPDAAGGVVYRLAPWRKEHVIRVLEVYDEETERARASEQNRRAGAIRKRRASFLLAPLLGHLPAAVQNRMESEFGAPARGMTIASALPLLVLGVVGVLAALVASFGGGAAFAGWPIVPLPLAGFFFAESTGRLAYAFVTGGPIGSIAGALFAQVFRRWRSDRRPLGAGYSSTRRSEGSGQEEA